MAEPNFDGIDSLDGIDLDALTRGVSGAVTGLYPVTTELTATAAGETVGVVHGQLVQTRQDLDATATDLARVAEAIRILREARDAWRRDAPRDAEIDAARQRWVDARQALIDAADDGTAAVAAQRRCEAALRDLQALEEKRDAADNALKSALEHAKEKMPARTDRVESGSSREQRPSPAPEAPASGSPRGAPGAPAAAPGGTPGPAASPSTSTSTSTGSGSPDAAKLASALSAAQQPQPAAAAPQQPAAQAPAMGAPAAAPAGGAPTRSDKRGALTSRDFGDLLGDGAPVGFGLASGAPSAQITPSAPASSAPASAPPPATNPGTSREGLSTPTPVNGRSTPAPTAFDAPETKTSGATSTASGSPATAGGRTMGAGMHGAGMGAPMMPMMPPVPQRGGGGNDSEHKVLSYDGREHLHGEDAKAEAVRGGTIAQKRPD